jgi:hypothetical protein
MSLWDQRSVVMSCVFLCVGVQLSRSRVAAHEHTIQTAVCLLPDIPFDATSPLATAVERCLVFSVYVLSSHAECLSCVRGSVLSSSFCCLKINDVLEEEAVTVEAGGGRLDRILESER